MVCLATEWPSIFSPIQLRQPELFKQVKDILNETGVDPNLIELEITEGTAMSCLESAISTTKQFQSLGIHISLDDFGTGFLITELPEAIAC